MKKIIILILFFLNIVTYISESQESFELHINNKKFIDFIRDFPEPKVINLINALSVAGYKYESCGIVSDWISYRSCWFQFRDNFKIYLSIQNSIIIDSTKEETLNCLNDQFLNEKIWYITVVEKCIKDGSYKRIYFPKYMEGINRFRDKEYPKIKNK
jgi:hypothetical protein